jgi:hypothetical protein
MNFALKATSIAIYVLALASLAGVLPRGGLDRVWVVAAVLLVVHTLELVFMFKKVRLYRGPFALSVLLTLLFGLLHWQPLADAEARTQARG